MRTSFHFGISKPDSSEFAIIINAFLNKELGNVYFQYILHNILYRFFILASTLVLDLFHKVGAEIFFPTDLK